MSDNSDRSTEEPDPRRSTVPLTTELETEAPVE
jgi:hypothetical protein